MDEVLWSRIMQLPVLAACARCRTKPAIYNSPDDGWAFLLAGTKASYSHFAAAFLTPAPFTLTQVRNFASALAVF
jgi:hypothetical protein